MGCQQSVQIYNGDIQLDTFDQELEEVLAIPITDQQIDLIKINWAFLSQDLTKLGAECFTRLFKKRPGIHEYFKVIAGERSAFEKADAQALEEHGFAEVVNPLMDVCADLLGGKWNPETEAAFRWGFSFIGKNLRDLYLKYGKDAVVMGAAIDDDAGE